MKTEVILVLAAVHLATGVINHLNASEYARMPPLFRLDHFNSCLRAPGDVYCHLDAKLVANDTSELFNLIQEYSDNNITHYDHTLIHWGICVTQLCRDHLSNSTDFGQAVEACLNETLYETYQLQSKLINETTFCTEYGETEDYDWGDYLVAFIFGFLLLLCFFGTLYDQFWENRSKSFAFRLLSSFSIKRSWQKLVVPSGVGPDLKLRRLKCLNGLKVISTLLVIAGHSAVSGFFATDNPEYQESTYQSPFYQVLYNGTFVTQNFFISSGFLLVFNILLMSEKRPVSWTMVPQGALLRWLRLTPVYAAVLAFTATWLRHLSSGPLWKPVVHTEVVDCRRDWWLHLLYVDNYVDNSQCMPQSWYLPGDMQLSILGLLIFCCLKTTKARQIAVALTLITGLITPAAHTYFQNLHAVLIVSPELGRNFFVNNPTFDSLFKRGHTNLTCYAMGMALGMALYKMQTKDFNVEKYRKYRFLYWAVLPVVVTQMLCGMVFYLDDIQVPLLVRAVYSGSAKMIYGSFICLLIAGTIFKLENVYRAVLEWGGWTALGRLSYCAYLIHVTIIRTSAVHYTSLQHINLYKVIINSFAITGATYALSIFCWLLVEAPLGHVVKLCFEGGREKPASDEQDMAATKKETEVKA